MKTRFILGSALAAVLLMWGGTGKVMAEKNIDKMAKKKKKRDKEFFSWRQLENEAR